MRPSFSVWCIDVFLFFSPKIVECYWTRRRSLSPPCCRSWTGVETLRPSLPPSPPPAQEKDSYWGHFVWPTSTEVRPTAVLVHLVTNVRERERKWLLSTALCCVPGFFKVLSELTKTGDVTPELFTSRFVFVSNLYLYNVNSGRSCLFKLLQTCVWFPPVFQKSLSTWRQLETIMFL